MKNNLLYKSLLFAGLGIAFIGFKSDSNGKGGGSSSSGCNCDGAANSNTIITIVEAPLNGYTPETTYTLNLTVANTLSGMTAAGFSIKASAGALSTISGTTVKGGDLVHSSPKSLTLGAALWSIPWTAPAIGVGDVTVNFAGNIVNGNGNTSGDQYNTGSIKIAQNISASLTNTINNKIQITPNPCTNQLTITDASILKNIQVLNLNGQNCNIPVAMQGSNAVLHVENLSTGLYILSAIENGVISTTKFYKKLIDCKYLIL
jgi:hypothetical protein